MTLRMEIQCSKWLKITIKIRKGREMKIKVTKRPTTTKEKVIGGVGWIAVIGCIAYLIIK